MRQAIGNFLLRRLQEVGIKHIFGVPGDYNLALLQQLQDTGRLKWYFQYTPHDTHDWDANQTPVLADVRINGQPRKVLMQANRNGFLYVLDRTNGKFIAANAYGKAGGAIERLLRDVDQEPNGGLLDDGQATAVDADAVADAHVAHVQSAAGDLHAHTFVRRTAGMDRAVLGGPLLRRMPGCHAGGPRPGRGLDRDQRQTLGLRRPENHFRGGGCEILRLRR